MLECSHCGTLVSEFRPKFFMVLEKVDPMPPNVKESSFNKRRNYDITRSEEYVSRE